MKTFEDLNTGEVKNHVIILDIDGTLTSDGNSKLSIGVLKKVKHLSKNNRIILFSNKKNHERNREIADICGVEYLQTKLKKPSKAILELIKDLNDKKVLVIGDKFLTDETFAKRISAEFIKVKRVESKNDRFITKLTYIFDDGCHSFAQLLTGNSNRLNV